jgi:hypothetical protein
MSRYSIPALHSEHQIVVGWDSPLASFFAEVIDQNLEAAIARGECSEEEVEPMLLWVGAIPGEIPTLEQLQAVIAPFAVIPNDTIAQLQSDYDQPWSPSPMQQFGRRFIEQHNTPQ